MKRVWAIIAIAVTVWVAAFGQETAAPKKSQAFRMSVGGGGFVSGDFSTWNVDEDVSGDLNRYDATLLGVGPYGFVDFKYVELNVGLMLGKLKNSSTESDLAENSNFPAETLSLHGSVYLKYPVTISDRFSLFPVAGIDYDLYLWSRKDDGRDAEFPISAGTQDASALEALSALSFKLGAGLDTYFTDHLFLRTELLYGIKLPNKMEKYLNDVRQNIDWTLSHGGDFKIAIGYRF